MATDRTIEDALSDLSRKLRALSLDARKLADLTGLPAVMTKEALESLLHHPIESASSSFATVHAG